MRGTYRGDIDGLRAVAVIAVLLSHLRVPWMEGGYAGVDIFFVISGYVVFGDLLRRSESSQVSFAEFYLRRVRRLLPNLIAVSVFVLAAGVVLFLPSDFRRLPARIVAALLGFSNWLSGFQSGYFEPASEWNPMLHAWTLSVEFQFYLLVPLLFVVAGRRISTRFRLLVFCLIAASFGYALATSDPESGWHFYDSLARIWEFLIGICLQLVRHPRLSRWAAACVVSLALAVLAAVCLFLKRSDAYPDALTLLPTLATAALIVGLPSWPSVQRAFSAAPVAGLGRASYSIYLWHWPVIVYCSYVWPDFERHPAPFAASVLAILALSTAMYNWVEKPMRSPQQVPLRRFLYICAASGAIVGAACLGVLASKGWESRFPDRLLALDQEARFVSPRRSACHRHDFSKGLDASCVFGARMPPSVAVWSDSHGVELIQMLSPGLAERNAAAVLYSYSSCPPRQPFRVRTGCDRFNSAVLARLLRDDSIDTVVLAGALDTDRNRSDPRWPAEFTRAARALLAAGKQLILVYPIPEQPFHVPRAMFIEQRFGLPLDRLETSKADYRQRNRRVFATYAALGTENVRRVYPDEILCASGPCMALREGQPNYFDDNHLSLFGARDIARQTLLTLR